MISCRGDSSPKIRTRSYSTYPESRFSESTAESRDSQVESIESTDFGNNYLKIVNLYRKRYNQLIQKFSPSVETQDLILNEESDISQECYDRFLDYFEKKAYAPGITKLRMYWREGKVIIYELPSGIHEAIGIAFDHEVFYESNRLFGRLQGVLSKASAIIRLNGRTREPDHQFVHMKRNSNDVGDLVSQVILEVGKSQTLQSLHEAVQDYFGVDGIVMVIIIKKFPIKHDHTYTLLAAVYYKNWNHGFHPQFIINFGSSLPSANCLASIDLLRSPETEFRGYWNPDDPICDVAGLEPYLLIIPGEIWLNGVPQEHIPIDYHPFNNPYNMVIDLYNINHYLKALREDN